MFNHVTELRKKAKPSLSQFGRIIEWQNQFMTPQKKNAKKKDESSDSSEDEFQPQKKGPAKTAPANKAHADEKDSSKKQLLEDTKATMSTTVPSATFRSIDRNKKLGYQFKFIQEKSYEMKYHPKFDYVQMKNPSFTLNKTQCKRVIDYKEQFAIKTQASEHEASYTICEKNPMVKELKKLLQNKRKVQSKYLYQRNKAQIFKSKAQVKQLMSQSFSAQKKMDRSPKAQTGTHNRLEDGDQSMTSDSINQMTLNNNEEALNNLSGANNSNNFTTPQKLLGSDNRFQFSSALNNLEGT